MEDRLLRTRSLMSRLAFASTLAPTATAREEATETASLHLLSVLVGVLANQITLAPPEHARYRVEVLPLLVAHGGSVQGTAG